jgi:hypothetical protein
MKVDLAAHKFQAKAGQMHLTSTNHHIRMNDPNGDGKFFLQRGRVFMGENFCIPKDEVPDWIHESIKLMNPKVLADCGFGEGEAKKKIAALPDEERHQELHRMGYITDEELADLMAKPPVEEFTPIQERQLSVDEIHAELMSQMGDDEPDTAVIDYSTWKRPQLMAECKDRDIKMSPSDKNDDLIAKLQA